MRLGGRATIDNVRGTDRLVRVAVERTACRASGPMACPSLWSARADTQLIATAALTGLRAIYRKGFRYEKAGVMLVELQPDTVRQGELDLFDGAVEPQFAAARDRVKLMAAVDVLNARYGRGAVQLGSNSVAPTTRPWSMNQGRRTPRYTTIWEEMPVVHAS